jgi:MFS family permease
MMPNSSPSNPSPTPTAPDAWAALRRPVFRRLWVASLVSGLGTWMQTMGAGWLMAELTQSPAQVALVQAAQALPMFLLALPAGALADIVDRRRQLIDAQVWMFAFTLLLTATTYAGMTGPGWLLAMTFLIGCGAAAMTPAWSASVQELVPRAELQSAVALNGISINVSRALGPALGGLILAWTGTATVFLLNALSFLGVIMALRAWRREPTSADLPAERLLGALRGGYRYARHAPILQRVLLRELAFFPFASAVWALLPLIAREGLAGDARLYGVLFGCIGAGAVAGAFLLPRITRRVPRDRLVALATLLYAAASGLLAAVGNAYAAAAILLVVGACWLAVVASMQVAVQTALPPWVRARGLALYWAVLMGSMALGSAAWGLVAEHIGISGALGGAAAGLAVMVPISVRARIGGHDDLDLSPSMHWPEPFPAEPPGPDTGPVLVTVEYRIRPENVSRFLKGMRTVRHMRLRDGAAYWQIFRDTEDSQRFVEHFLTESWVEHLRQHARVTVADRDIERRMRALHSGDGPPKVVHYIAAGSGLPSAS